MALHLRPEFRGLILTEESSDAQRRAYAWKWAPTLSAFGKANVGNYVGFTGDNYAWSVGAQLDWTLFDGGTRDAQRHLAAAQAAQAAGAGRRAHRLDPRRSGQQPQPARHQARGG